MPAIITHDQFGHDLYRRLYQSIGESTDEMEAFLLGNQGPDPLFYAVVNPLLKRAHSLGSTMHRDKPNQLLAAFKQALELLDDRGEAGANASINANARASTSTANAGTCANVGPSASAANPNANEGAIPTDRSIGRAYVLGFLGHYALDSHAHPLVFSYERALCDAGEPNLTRADRHEVHAVIESELDEMMLFTRRGLTIATFNPSTEILRGSQRMLGVVSRLYEHMAPSVYETAIPPRTFELSVHQFRAVQKLFYSPTGAKRALLGSLEEKLRRYSFYRSMSHRAIEATTCPYDNHEHQPWKNPFTEEVRTDSFHDLFEKAQLHAERSFNLFDDAEFDAEAARSITGDLNFSGEPTVARIVAVE